MSCAASAQQAISVYATAIDRTNAPVQLQASQLQAKNLSIASIVPIKPAEISCVVVWDSSDSEREAFEAMKLAAVTALKELLVTPQRCTFVDFDNVSRTAAGSTNDPDGLIKAISKSKPGGGTAAYDAVIAGCNLLAQERLAPPHVMYLFSDFEDNQSHHTREEMLKALLKSSTRVYALVPDSKNPKPSGTAVVEHIARETGGRVVIVPLRTKQKQIEDALRRELEVISAELKSWQLIEFTAPGASKKDRVLDLKVSSVDTAIQLKLPTHYVAETK